MTTYNTYQAARIANPECEIYIRTGEFWPEKSIAPSPRTYESRGFKLCNPANYCMTVEKFLADGHKFVEGDSILNHDDLVYIGLTRIGCDVANEISSLDDKRYILRAAALEEKKPFLQTGEEYEHTKTLNFIYERLIEVHGENPNLDYMHRLKNAIIMVEDRESPCNKAAPEKKPRTKVEYERVSGCIFDLEDDFNSGALYCKQGGEYLNITNACSIGVHLASNGLYRRIETPMTWKEELYNYLDNSCEMSDDFDDSFTIEIEGRPLEFNLNDDEFVDMCKLVASLNSVN